MAVVSHLHGGRCWLGYRYLYILPVSWSLVMAGIWFLTWNSDQTMLPMLAGLLGHWLPAALGSTGHAFVWLQIAAGALTMSLLGLLLDHLRVRPAWAWTYLLVLGTGVLVHGVLRLRITLVSVLFTSCIAIYVVVILLCGIGAAAWFSRRIHANRVSAGER